MNRTAALVLLLLPSPPRHENVSNPKASYIDVQQRHEQLTHNKDPRTAQAIASLKFCSQPPGHVAPPAGRMIIPPHYLSGSHGPVNPAEAPPLARTTTSNIASPPA